MQRLQIAGQPGDPGPIDAGRERDLCRENLGEECYGSSNGRIKLITNTTSTAVYGSSRMQGGQTGCRCLQRGLMTALLSSRFDKGQLRNNDDTTRWGVGERVVVVVTRQG